MSDAAITTFIDIQARNTASAEFRKVSIEGKKAAAEVGGGFKGLASQGIGDAVNEIKSFVRAFGLIKVGKVLFNLAAEFVAAQKSIAEARRELQFYAAMQGPLGQDLLLMKDRLAKVYGISDAAAGSIARLGNAMQISSGQTVLLAEKAAILATSAKSSYQGNAAQAFEDLAKASFGFYDGLQQRTQLAINSQQRFSDFMDGLLADQIEYNTKFATSWDETLQMKAAADRLRQHAPIPGLDPLDKDREKRDQEQAREDAKAMRADNREAAQEAKANARDLREEMHVLAMAGQDMGDAFGGAFAGLITGAMTAKEAFRAFVADMVRMIARLIAEFIALAIARSIAGAGSFGSIAAGASAGGNGANLPTPGIGGGGGAGLGGMPPGGPRSLPGSLGAGMGGGGGDTINIYAIDAKSFQQRLTEEQGHLGKLSMDSNRRSSTFRRAFGSQGRVR